MNAGIVERLLGSWRLESFRIVYQDGQVVHPMGEDADGLIVYTAAGYMSGHLMQRGRPRFAAVRSSVAERSIGTPEEIVAAFNGYFGYFCKFDVDPELRRIRHRVVACHLPDWEGRTLERFYSFPGAGAEERLALRSAPITVEGRPAHNELLFRREPVAAAESLLAGGETP
jgi:hypothetical protein